MVSLEEIGVVFRGDRYVLFNGVIGCIGVEVFIEFV